MVDFAAERRHADDLSRHHWGFITAWHLFTRVLIRTINCKAVMNHRTPNGHMTQNEFRRLALALPEAIESEHMNHPDFRVGGKIFATLLPAKKCGMVKLTPEQQREFVAAEPAMFVPVPGGWGRSGCTNVILKSAKATSVRRALFTAWCTVAPKHLLDGDDDAME